MLGVALRLLPTSTRKDASVFYATIAHHAPKRIYFLVREFVEGVTRNIFSDSGNSFFVRREMEPGFVMELNITKKTQRQIYLDKVYEPHITEYILRNLRAGDTFIDIGANVGYYALMASILVGNKGVVIAFEPEKENFIRLMRNINLNKFANITYINKAVAREKGERVLNIHPLNEGGHSIERLEINKEKEKLSHTHLKQRVQSVSLDEYVDRIRLVNKACIIKIDVEGFELEVLRGMQNILALSNPPKIICEVSKKKEEIFELLKSHGYRAFTLNEEECEVFVSTDRRKRDYLFKRT